MKSVLVSNRNLRRNVMKTKILAVLFGTIVMLVAGQAIAQANLFINGDFENPAITSAWKFMADNPIDGWTGSQSYVRRMGYYPEDVAQSGSQYLVTEQPSTGISWFNTSSGPWVPVVFGHRYTLSFWVAYNPGAPAPRARVLFAGTEDIFQTTDTWAQRVYNYTATTTSIYLQFRQENSDGLGYAKWDNVVFTDLDAPVPEPSSALALSGGVLGLLGLWRRRS